MDYTNLNESCLKYSFPLPRIYQIVDPSVEHEMLSYLDAFSGYYQIPMDPPGANKTDFITPHELYYYNMMPFVLKNARATYQRLVTKIFRPLIGKTMEVYIDDMLIQSKECLNHTEHLQETFELLCMNGMKLNPLKCVFGVSSGKFMGFMVTRRRIEANDVQLRVVIESKTPTTRNGVQQLTGQLASLGQFISHFRDRLKPFFTNLKWAKQTSWDKECNQALIII